MFRARNSRGPFLKGWNKEKMYLLFVIFPRNSAIFIEFYILLRIMTWHIDRKVKKIKKGATIVASIRCRICPCARTRVRENFLFLGKFSEHYCVKLCFVGFSDQGVQNVQVQTGDYLLKKASIKK